MMRQPPRCTCTDTLFPDRALFRSGLRSLGGGWRRALTRRGRRGRGSVLSTSNCRPKRTEGSAKAVTAAKGTTRRCGTSARSEEHTSELQSLMRTSYAVFCLKKQKHNQEPSHINNT